MIGRKALQFYSLLIFILAVTGIILGLDVPDKRFPVQNPTFEVVDGAKQT